MNDNSKCTKCAKAYVFNSKKMHNINISDVIHTHITK